MAPTEIFLKRSRALWIDRERDARAQAEHAHRMHQRRARQLAELETPNVVAPLEPILADSWGWHPGTHDGIDLICNPAELLLAMCKSTVVRADAGGWWGKGAPSDPAVRARGDGIIILRALISAGPIRPGLNLCYGHAEQATVAAGQTVEAGQVIGRAGYANAWHVHFMVNARADTKGIGDRDPRPIIDYARAQ
jgi:murein DD-endopeptidase MepM/ murein hydrolase activator NlpD